MRAVIQRVQKASVCVNGETVSTIGRGLCVLIGIHKNDSRDDMEYMVRKILNIRLFEDTSGKRWNLSVKDLGLEVLCISQFTLYCEMKGNKPDYRHAMGGDLSKEFYENFLTHMRGQYKPEKIKDGIFGAMMQVDIQNDGPVTVNIDSPMKNANKMDQPQLSKDDS
ncbi:D-aminoacyl-tRNA deacylase [Oratosquilla oratoria]|uniref:D-aminoacyl-tRNA deacylase n=1 Tax=Oratosquilla oratoria TaxID=337810 RepID=UPI003F76A8AB